MVEFKDLALEGLREGFDVFVDVWKMLKAWLGGFAVLVDFFYYRLDRVVVK